MKKIIRVLSLALLIILKYFFTHAQAPSCLWAYNVGNSNHEFSNAITTDQWGNVYTIGEFNGYIDFDPGPGSFYLNTPLNYSVYVSKCDSNGNFIWAKQFVGNGEFNQGLTLAVDDSGNVYTGGTVDGPMDFDPGTDSLEVYNLNGTGANSAFVCKLDSAGNFKWANAFQSSILSSVYNVKLDNNYNVFVSGFFKGTCDFDPDSTGLDTITSDLGNSTDIFISRLNSNGYMQWTKTIHDPGNELAYAMDLDKVNDYIYFTGEMTGTGQVDFDPSASAFNLTPANGYIYVCKLDTAGSLVWAKQLGYGVGDAISFDPSGGGSVYVSGQAYGGDFDPDTSAVYDYNTGGGHDDLYLLKLNTSGNFSWLKVFGSNFHENLSSMTVDLAGDIYIGGNFGDTADFDPDTTQTFYLNILNPPYADAFLLKLNSNGNFIWVKPVRSDTDELITGIAVDFAGRLYICGHFRSNLSIDTTTLFNHNTSPAATTWDMFTARLQNTVTTGINILTNDNLIKVFPVPFNDVINVSLNELNNKGSYKLSDVFGKLISTAPITSNQFQLNTRSLVKGIYLLHIFSNNEHYVRKLIKQ